jgi:hypothetical protein
MPRNSFRHIAVAALLALAVAASAAAGPLGPLGAGRVHQPARHQATQPAGLWSFFVHLIGASGGTFDPNGGRR